MLRAILNKSWRQHTTKQQLYGHLPPITKTIQVRRTRYAGRGRDELISDVLQWTPAHRRAKAGRPARTYRQQLCADVGCSLEDLREEMDDREGWREWIREIFADGMTWWLWCNIYIIYIYIYRYIYIGKMVGYIGLQSFAKATCQGEGYSLNSKPEKSCSEESVAHFPLFLCSLVIRRCGWFYTNFYRYKQITCVVSFNSSYL